VVEVREKDLMVGDLVGVAEGEMVRVDGVVVWEREFSVNEGRTVTRQDARAKHSFFKLKTYDQAQRQFDPFVFAGSSVIYGKA
jgi:hypothetical protein